ncbi:hypothetical protein CsSME_00037508 [Camellia sinensis var. sinensis]
MALLFLLVSGRPSVSLISCLAAPPAPPPPNPNPTALPSLTCALQCPHFQSCSGCTQEYNLNRPIILDEATDFFNKHGVSDFTFDTCRLICPPPCLLSQLGFFVIRVLITFSPFTVGMEVPRKTRSSGLIHRPSHWALSRGYS